MQGINIKEHFKLTAVYTFFAAFPALLQLIVYPIIEGEGRLGPTDFGHLAVTEAIITFFYIVSIFGMSNAVARFYYDFRNSKDGYSRLLSTVLTGIALRGLLLLGAVYMLSPLIETSFADSQLSDFGSYGFSLVVSGVSRAIVATVIALYRNEKRVGAFVVVSAASGIARSLFQVIGVFFFSMSFVGYVHGAAIGGGSIALTILLFTLIRSGVRFDFGIARQIAVFAFPLFFYEFITWGITFADRFFMVGNPAQLGIYDNAMKFAVGIQFILLGLTAAVQPDIFRSLHEGGEKNIAKIKTLSNMLVVQSIAIIIACIIPVMLFIDLFYQTELRASAALIPIVFVRFVLRAQYHVFALPVMFAKKTKELLYVNSSALLVNLLLNWVLIPRYGYYGAISAFIVASLVQVVAVRYVQERVMSISWNLSKVFVFPLVIVSLSVAGEYLRISIGFNSYILATTLLLISFTLFGWLYRNELKELVGRVKKTSIFPWQ